MCNVLGSVIKKAGRTGVKVETIKLPLITDFDSGTHWFTLSPSPPPPPLPFPPPSQYYHQNFCVVFVVFKTSHVFYLLLLLLLQ